MFEFEKLSWDTDFFKKKIGKIIIKSSYYDSDLRPEIIRLKNLGFELIYLFVEEDLKLSEQTITEFNIKLVDIKLVYSLHINYLTDAIQLLSFNGDPQCLYKLALQSGEFSRFRLDKNFNNGEFEKLYFEWINNSINSKFAEYVPVSYFENEIVGFATLKIQNQVGSIGLIAVDNIFRSKGIGTQLINSIKSYLYKLNVSIVEVATQLENKQACKFYEKMGFQIKSKTNIYHLWL